MTEPGRPVARGPLVSLVAPVDNAAGHGDGLLGMRQDLSRRHPALRFELVLVDDGSSEGAADRLLAAARADETVRLATLRRTFGTYPALCAGLAVARGDAVLVLDAAAPGSAATADRLLTAWRAGHDVVWAAGPPRRGRLRAVLDRLPGLPVVPGERRPHLLVDRAVLEGVHGAPRRQRDVVAAIGRLGRRQTTIVVEPAAAPGRTLGQRVRRVWGWFAGLYSAPFLILLLVVLAVTGWGLVSGLSLLALGLVVKIKVWSLVVAGMLFVGGLNLMALGGFGEYLWRGSGEHPGYVLAGVHDHGPDPAQP